MSWRTRTKWKWQVVIFFILFIFVSFGLVWGVLVRLFVFFSLDFSYFLLNLQRRWGWEMHCQWQACEDLERRSMHTQHNTHTHTHTPSFSLLNCSKVLPLLTKAPSEDNIYLFQILVDPDYFGKETKHAHIHTAYSKETHTETKQKQEHTRTHNKPSNATLTQHNTTLITHFDAHCRTWSWTFASQSSHTHCWRWTSINKLQSFLVKNREDLWL